MAYLSLGPASIGIYTLLNVSGLTGLVSSRIYDDVPQAPTFPFVWYEVKERDVRGFGVVGFPEIELRVHIFSTYEGAKEVQAIGAKVIELLRDESISITGYAQAGLIFYDDTQLLNDQVIAGVKVREMVAMFRIYAEETDASQLAPWIQTGWIQ